MKELFLPDAEAVAQRAAQVIAAAARAAVRARGRFVLATSGGTTPWSMMRALAREDVPWTRTHVFQVDERVAPAGHPQRNLTKLDEAFLSALPMPLAGVHAMPVEEADLARAAAEYCATLRAEAGDPAVLDLLQLGLGEDGHTASLVPQDAALDVTDRDVAATALYRGYRRLTLTYPAINRAREILWIVTGAAKGPALARLRQGDRSIPAGRVRRDRALILADVSAQRACMILEP
jgi:6-phosphogluconolactonase